LIVATAGGAGAWAVAAPRLVQAAESGVTSDRILMGHSGVLSGPLGVPVQTLLAGAQLAFSQVNASGGVFGRQIELLALDDELVPAKALANCRQLLAQSPVFGFFNNVGSATTAAVAPLLAAGNVPLVAGYAVGDSVREKVKGQAYFLRAGGGREAQAMVQQLTTLGITRIAVAHIDNPGGAEVAAQFVAALAEIQLKPSVVAAAGATPANNPAVAAKALAAAQPQAVIMHLPGALPGELMKACWALGFNPSFYGTSIVPGEVTARVLGDKVRGLAISQVVPFPWAPVEPTAATYRRLCERAKVDVGYYSFEGYLNALLLIEGLRRTGAELTRARFHAAMRTLKTRLSSMNVDFTNGNATGSRYVDLVQVTQGGRFIR
jgi:ABC-type branched-subunit amino acid transport system substrate-binding protein